MSKKSRTKRESGFSLAEFLVAMSITLIVVAAMLAAFNDTLRANEGVTLMAEMDQNLRAGMNRPAPPATSLTFDPTWTALPAITPGAGLGPILLGQATDVMSLMYADN